MTPDEELRLVDVLDCAFESDPLFHFIQPDPTRRRAAMTALHRASLRYAQHFGVVDVAPDHAGVALWLPPGSELLTWPRMVQTGFLSVGLRLGTAIPRMFTVESTLARMHKTHAPRKHWYLFFLAVDPARQAQGTGTMLLEQGAARARSQGVPVYLETQTTENVAYYTRRGFVVHEEQAIAPELKTWSLTRE